MPQQFSQAYGKAGLPPGTARYTGSHAVPTTIRALDLSDGGCTLHEGLDVDGAIALAMADSLTWIDVVGLADERVVVGLGRALGLHPLALEDVLQVGTRPKAELHDGHMLIVLKLLHLLDIEDDLVLDVEHISVALVPGAIITFQEVEADPFGGLRRQLLEGVGALRGALKQNRAPRLLHAVGDAVVDDAYEAIEALGREVEELEASLLEDPPEDALERIQEQRRSALLIRRVLRPMRETIFSVRRMETDLLPDRMDAYWTDVVDHLDQLLESLELYREMVMGMVDLHHTAVSNRLNDTMRVLTVISVFFLPLSFLAGLYGMNFSYMPELQPWWSYFVLLGVMATLAIGMLIWFRWRKWI